MYLHKRCPAQELAGGLDACPSRPARIVVATGRTSCRLSGRLKNAIAAVFAGASWQHCRTHFMANLLTRVPKRAQPGVATQYLLAWCAPSTSNCLSQRSTANWTEWWNNSGSPFPRWRSCWRMPRRTSYKRRGLQWRLGRHKSSLAEVSSDHWQKLFDQDMVQHPQERLNREIRRRRACPRKGTWWAFSPTGYQSGAASGRRGAGRAPLRRSARADTTSAVKNDEWAKPAATSPSPTPPAARHCRSPICWKQRPDQHQQGRRAFTLLDGTLPMCKSGPVMLAGYFAFRGWVRKRLDANEYR